ncbi:cytochrome C oxidase copper chaperone-domain-containing protein [Globomyces pollinis-pini]|nr:cytochrome C oxidase copper chaperone-domain-containing protein [Globomyces pollinis-pini]
MMNGKIVSFFVSDLTNMGAQQSTFKDNSPNTLEKPKCKPCCACPETRDARDLCVITNGEENCYDLIKAHQDCMRALGFNLEEIPKPKKK